MTIINGSFLNLKHFQNGLKTMLQTRDFQRKLQFRKLMNWIWKTIPKMFQNNSIPQDTCVTTLEPWQYYPTTRPIHNERVFFYQRLPIVQLPSATAATCLLLSHFNKIPFLKCLLYHLSFFKNYTFNVTSMIYRWLKAMVTPTKSTKATF